jgi:hypothetical protein
MPTLTAKSLKITAVLDPAEVAAVPTPEGKPKVGFRIKSPDRTVHALITAKSVRKARKLIESCPEAGVSVIVIGRLVEHDVLADAGLTAQPKKLFPKPSELAAEDAQSA